MNWLLLKNSLLVSGGATLLATGFGLLAALWLAGLPPRWRAIFIALSISALALPPFLVTNCWLDLIGPAGRWRGWLPINVMSLGGAVGILALLFWPIPVLMVVGAWRRLEPAQLESDPAVRGWALLRVLLLPLAGSALARAAVLTFILALGNFAVPAILQVKVLPAEMWIRFTTAFDSLGVLKMSWPLVVAPLLLLAWFARRELPWPHLAAPVSARVFRRQLGAAWFVSAGLCALPLCGLSVGVPLWQLASARRTWTELPGAVAAGQNAVWNSLWFAAVAATVVMGVGLLVVALRRRGMGRYSFFAALLWLPFLVPGVLLGIGLIAVFNRPWTLLFYQSAGIVLLAFGIRYIGFGWHTVAHAAQGVDRDLMDAARLEGATRWQLLRHVQWPQIRPQLAAAWYVVFLLCLWDVESMILVYPPGGETLALRIFNLLHYGHNAQVNALCLVLLALALLPLLLWVVGQGVANSRRALLTAKIQRAQHGRATNACVLQIRNPKSEIRNKFEIQIGNVRNWITLSGFDHFFFGIWICFGFRISDFGFGVPARLRLGCPGPFTSLRLRYLHMRFWLALAGTAALLCSCSRSGNPALHSQIFDHAEIIGTRGVGIGQLNKPRSVAVDLQDNLYVVDMTGRVQKFSPNGAFELFWQMPQIENGKPKGMGRDRDGNIIVVEPHYQRLNFFSTSGKLLAQWGEKGTNAGQLIMPRAVAVNSRKEIFVSEYGEVERIQKFIMEPIGSDGGSLPTGKTAEAVNSVHESHNTRLKPGANENPGGDNMPGANGLTARTAGGHQPGGSVIVHPRLLQVIGHAGTGPGEFNRAEGLCVDAQDRLYVADSCNHRIQIFTSDGKFLRMYGRPGKGKGEFSYPYDICVDAQGRQYVAEFGNSRIQVFDAHDQPLEIIGEPGAEPGQFANPWSLALDSAGNLYVADSQNHRVQKLVRRKDYRTTGLRTTGQPDHGPLNTKD